ncbi:MAG: hypothetical protein SF028_14140 [Candidatus Sumerlaeia bacterium]|nr:hypothetical protein [Candidatus Sumerlaeia bacterium]
MIAALHRKRLLLRRSLRNGISLVSVVISIGLMSIVSVAFAAGAVFSLRATQDYVDRQMVLDAARYYEARIFAADKARIGEPNLTASEAFEWAIRPSNTTNHYSDQQYNAESVQVRVSFAYSGWGFAANSTGPNNLVKGVVGSNPSGTVNNQRAWNTTIDGKTENNEWAGSLVLIIRGTGENQIGRIISNTPTQLNITTDIRDPANPVPATPAYNGAAPWDVTPNSTSFYRINNGRTVDMMLRWNNAARAEQTLTRRVLVN